MYVGSLISQLSGLQLAANSCFYKQHILFNNSHNLTCFCTSTKILHSIYFSFTQNAEMSQNHIHIPCCWILHLKLHHLHLPYRYNKNGTPRTQNEKLDYSKRKFPTESSSNNILIHTKCGT